MLCTHQGTCQRSLTLHGNTNSTSCRPLSAGKQIVAPLQSLIGGRILALREQRVLDADLAELYFEVTNCDLKLDALRELMTNLWDVLMFQARLEQR